MTMATLLSIFVIQSCPQYNDCDSCSTQGSGDNDGCIVSGISPPACQLQTYHDCSFEENFTYLTRFNVFVIVWNFLTLGSICIQYFTVFRRERFLTYKLSRSLEKSRIHLASILNNYPHIQERLHIHDLAVAITSAFAIVMQVVNVIVSGILVFYYYYDGYRTATSFITQILLMLGFMYGPLQSSIFGLRYKVAFSNTEFEPVSFNVIDSHYREKEIVNVAAEKEAQMAIGQPRTWDSAVQPAGTEGNMLRQRIPTI